MKKLPKIVPNLHRCFNILSNSSGLLFLHKFSGENLPESVGKTLDRSFISETKLTFNVNYILSTYLNK